MRRDYLPLLALLGAGFVVGFTGLLVVGPAPAAAGALLVAAAVLAVVAEGALGTRSDLSTSLENAQAGSALRAAARDAILVGAVAAWDGTDRADLLVVAAGIGISWLLRVVVEVLDHDLLLRRLQFVTWRNLEVPGIRRCTPLYPRLVAARGVVQAVVLTVLSIVVSAHILGAAHWVLWVGAGLAVAALGSIAAVVLVDAARVRRDSSPQEVAELVGAELGRRGTEVVFYYSRPEAVGYIANVWMPVLEQLDRRMVVLVREEHNADLVETTTIPVVCVPEPTDVERVVPSTVRLALYPSNVAKNGHLLRLPGIVDVFIGHGDSDKGGSATTLTRSFDEAWVSGPAARERYRVEQVGVRDDQIREIGRPQLAQIRQVHRRLDDATTANGADGAEGTDHLVTVLYAPTREGFFSSWQYSSVLAQGQGIVRTLLSTPGIRLLFKPHPGTGTDDPAFGRAVDRLVHLVVTAGPPHEVVASTEGLYAAFNRADVLVSDISSVITDFLASGKPYVVTDPAGMDVEEFRRTFPSARGAWILTGDGTEIGEALHDARTTDRYSAQRARTAAHLLGDTSGDPIARFDAAIDSALSRVHGAPAADRAAAEGRRA